MSQYKQHKPRALIRPLSEEFVSMGGQWRCQICPQRTGSKLMSLNRAPRENRSGGFQSFVPIGIGGPSNLTATPSLDLNVFEDDGPTLNDMDSLKDSPKLPSGVWTASSGAHIYLSAGGDDDPLNNIFDSLEDEDSAYEDPEDPLYSHHTGNDGDSSDDDESQEHLQASAEWFPWPDKAGFLTDILFSLPRLRFSRAQQKAVLLWAKELGAKVPTYHAHRRTQTSLLKELGAPTIRQVSGQGNIWYLNDIGDAIGKDFSNPVSRANMQLYPQMLGRVVEE
ncbi:hypothetical protein CPB83DRAFT_838520, partial [Crepidotus variabilis]